MKITKIIIATVLIISFYSCNKKEEIIDTLSNNEAKELIASSLQKNTSGFDAEIEEIAKESTENYAVNSDCNIQYQDNFERHYAETVVTANYTVNWTYQMNCNNLNIPQSINFLISSNGNYHTQNIVSQDSTESSMDVFGLQPSADSLTFSGYFKRVGTQELNAVNTRNVSSTVEIMFTDITVNKETYLIDSGNATIVLTGTTTDNQTFNFTANLVFNGQRTATLTINNETYTIDLN